MIPLDQNFTSEARWRYYFSGRPMGMETYYDRYGSRTFPLILVWGRADNRSETGFPEIEDGHVTIACVKVDTVVAEGSALPAGAAVDDGDEDDSNDYEGSQGDGGNGEEEQGGQAAGEQPTGGSNALLQPSMLEVVAGVLGAVAVC